MIKKKVELRVYSFCCVCVEYPAPGLEATDPEVGREHQLRDQDPARCFQQVLIIFCTQSSIKFRFASHRNVIFNLQYTQIKIYSLIF
jgi:hypothetical protein